MGPQLGKLATRGSFERVVRSALQAEENSDKHSSKPDANEIMSLVGVYNRRSIKSDLFD
jgi:hypothetical protein